MLNYISYFVHIANYKILYQDTFNKSIHEEKHPVLINAYKHCFDCPNKDLHYSKAC